MDFVFKTMDFALKMVILIQTGKADLFHKTGDRTRKMMNFVSKNDEFCIKNDGFCIKIMGFVLKIMGFVFKIMDFVRCDR